MHLVIIILGGVAAGVALGLAFFGGLWWTTRRLAVTERPGLLLAASLVGRLGLLALCLTALARIDGSLLVAVAAGLMVTRVAMTHAAARGPQLVPATVRGRAGRPEHG